MIGFLLASIGLVALALVAFTIGVIVGVYAVSKEVKDKIDAADPFEKEILKKVFDK